MSKWIAEFDLEDGDTMPEHMDLNYMGAKIDFHCRPMWIPVSERLPEAEYGESDSVLVCFENETQDVLYFNGSNWCYPTGEIYISVNHKNGWHNKVVAWMPLPIPYKSQEMTIEDCTKMLIAKEKCMERDTSGTDTECNSFNCDDCSLCYEQGTMGEQKEALKFAVDTMRKYQKIEDIYYHQSGEALENSLRAVIEDGYDGV